MNACPLHRRFVALAVIAAVPAFLTPSALAEKNWNTAISSGNWNTPGNWLENAIPTNSDNVTLGFIDATSHTVTYNGSFTSNRAVNIRNTGTGTVTLSLSTGFNLTGRFINIAPLGNGQITQSGGNLTANTSIDIAGSTGSTGLYSLSGGTLVVASIPAGGLGLIVGDSGFGSFNQTAGLASITSPLYLGYVAGTGNYSLSGTGTLNVSATEYIGLGACGTFIQSAGMHVIGTTLAAQDLYFAYNASNCLGAYILSGTGSLAVTGNEYLGYAGFGTFNQSAGAHNVGTASKPGNLSLGYAAASSGRYALSGSGVLNVFGTETIGAAGAGAFAQSGGFHTIGTVTFPGTFYLGYTLGSTGTYSLSGISNFDVHGDEYIGNFGPGTFTQTAGTHVLGTTAASGTLYIGLVATGEYSLGATARLAVHGREFVGQGGIGNFIQSGGLHFVQGNTASAGYLIVGYNSPASGSYTLSDGSLSVDGAETIGSAGLGTFYQTGGTNTAGSLYIAHFPGSTGGYSLNGAAALLTVNGVYIGSDVVALGGAGVLNIQSGTMIDNAILKTGNVPGTAINISGGSLGAGDLVDIAPATAFTISGSGHLDLTSGKLIRRSTVSNLAADYATLRSYIINNQIRSLSASANTGLALMKSSDYLTLHPGATFSGQTLSSTDLLIKYTYLGDADLSGRITMDDYALLDAGFLLGNFDPITNPASWVHGDFNDDGKVDYQDYALIDAAFQAQSGVLANDLITQHAHEFGTAYTQTLAALESNPIPEPASLALLSLATLLLVRRRRTT